MGQSITSANAVLSIGVQKLYNAPVQIEGFSVDDAFLSEEVETTEVQMGIDGNLSAGYTPYPVPLEITLQANSAGNLIFDTLTKFQDQNREIYIVNVTIKIPAIGFTYDFTNGVLQKFTPMPAGKKVLQARKFTLMFQHMTPIPV